MTALLFGLGITGLVGGLLLFQLPGRGWGASQASLAAGLCFGGLAVVGLALVQLAAFDLWQGWRSQAWPPVPASVSSSRVVAVSQMRSSAPAYRAEVVYRYAVGGQAHSGSQLAFGDLATPRREAVEREIATHYAPGAMLTVHVNPADATQAVLKPGVQPKAGIFAALGLVFLLLGAWQLTRLARGARGAGPKSSRKGNP